MFKLSGDSLDWALAHVERFGDTDIFPRPFEFQAMRHSWDATKTYLANQDLDAWKTRPKRTCLTPKGKYAYRLSTQLDPLDALVYLGLVFEIGGQLEASRLPAADRIVLSHRFSPEPDGQLYSRGSNWTTFLNRSGELADETGVSHVVVADISDFYHRLYHHRVENMLAAATNGSGQGRVISKLLRQFADGNSYGIPVGPAASRLIADAAIDDVDQLLRAEGATFCRYSDDYRLFCTSYRDAYDKLARLAEVLYRNHGLTLQQHKTSIVTVDTFKERFLASPESEELSSLRVTFNDLVEQLVLDNPYEDINYDDLEPPQQALVDQLNLEGLFREQLHAQDVDIGLTRFLLRRLAQLDDQDLAMELVSNAEHFYTVIPAVVEYLAALNSIDQSGREHLGAEVMRLIDSSYVGHLPYHRCWLLSLFAGSGLWGQQDKFVSAYNGTPERFARRKCILAMGRSRLFYWFKAARDGALDMEPWERRAFLAGASCLAHDERRYWYGSIKHRLDQLEQAVVLWATANPF